MNEKQFNNFKKLIKHESQKALDQFCEEEIAALKDVDREDFFKHLQTSELFQGFFMRGFTSGMKWQIENKDNKFLF